MDRVEGVRRTVTAKPVSEVDALFSSICRGTLQISVMMFGAEVKVEVTRYGIMRCMGVEIYQLIDVKSYYIPKSLVDARLTKHCEFPNLPYNLVSRAQCAWYVDAARRYKAFSARSGPSSSLS